MFPKSFFSQDKTNLGECCVLMPFADDFKNVYAAIKSAIEGGQVCFHCTRADEFLRGGSVMSDILTLIGRAEIIVADLTKKNPNVFYELGIAHMVKDKEKVIIITQDPVGDVPFDVSHLRRLPYDNSTDGLHKLKRDLVSAFSQVGKFSWQFQVTDGGSYKKEEKIYRLDNRDLYTFGLSQVEVAIGGATFGFNVCRLEDGKEVELPEQEPGSLEEGGQVDIPGLHWELKLIKADGKTAKFGVGRRQPAQKAD